MYFAEKGLVSTTSVDAGAFSKGDNAAIYDLGEQLLLAVLESEWKQRYIEVQFGLGLHFLLMV